MENDITEVGCEDARPVVFSRIGSHFIVTIRGSRETVGKWHTCNFPY
jgi:hypothetical protein